MSTLAQVFQRNPRIQPAENGLILSYTEYYPSSSCYDGMQYIGDRQEVFPLTDEGSIACINKLMQIYRTEAETSTAIAILKNVKKDTDKDGM